MYTNQRNGAQQVLRPVKCLCQPGKWGSKSRPITTSKQKSYLFHPCLKGKLTGCLLHTGRGILLKQTSKSKLLIRDYICSYQDTTLPPSDLQVEEQTAILCNAGELA